MAEVRFSKPDVILSQLWTDISHRNFACTFHLLKQIPSPNLNPKVDFPLHGRNLEKSI